MSFRSFGVYSVAVFILFSCSNTVERKPQVAEKAPSETPIVIVKDGEYYLQEAKKSYANTQDSYQGNLLFLSAAEAFQTEGRCDKSIKMLQVVRKELNNEQLRRHSNLIIAECYFILDDSTHKNADTLLSNLPSDTIFSARIHALESQFYVRKKQWLKGASSLLKTAVPENEKSQKIWSLLKNLSLRELEQASLQYSNLQPWLQLAIINKRFALNPAEYKQQLLNWQSRNLTETIANNLPEEVIEMLQLEPITPSKIAVLIPLSGRLASQGIAIKKGILASYYQDLKNAHINENEIFKELHFFDSALKTPEELNTSVANFDVIIGPLIKEKLAALKDILPADKIMLGLNRLESTGTTSTSNSITDSLEAEPLKAVEQYFFSLAPEDEAQQLARHILKHQLVHPVIFAAEGSSTQRMAQAFINEWQKQTNNTPELTTFTTNKDMRIQVSSVLDVAQSKARIKEIEYLSNKEVFGVERNRRDIDAIILFASPEQTELLNPIIEASLSPFARKSLSVFASSRSYSIDINQNSLRDLRNLTFTDMPWMLPNHDWKALSSEVNELWPQEKDSLLRLFAMGVDAYNLIPQLRTLRLLSNVNSHGLTGDINIDSLGIIHRNLPLAQVKQDKVTLIGMD
ncbi:MAG: penicillin-binding protein activator [Paraglaciecola sp.]|uniref:penicillin-binding protein activator n=1 Tax=Paraglaciecola sp. TaxID=1920173 RepID=UPI003297C946